MKKFLPLVVLLIAAFVTEATAQSYKVIANEGVATTSISKDDLSDIFLKKKRKWDDGSAVTPIDLEARTQTRATFSEEVHGQGVGEIRTYWQQAAFSGAGTAPLERGSDADIIAFVKSTPGAVGYISADTDAAGVKVLTVN